MQNLNQSASDTLHLVLQLNENAIDYATSGDWEASLACISKRHDGLVMLFKASKDSLLSHRPTIISMTESIEKTDQQLRQLASSAKIDLEGKIAHLSLRKKASNAYQSIASQ